MSVCTCCRREEVSSQPSRAVWASKGGTGDWRLEQSQASERPRKQVRGLVSVDAVPANWHFPELKLNDYPPPRLREEDYI